MTGGGDFLMDPMIVQLVEERIASLDETVALLDQQYAESIASADTAAVQAGVVRERRDALRAALGVSDGV